jgi:HEAT repeat protein
MEHKGPLTEALERLRLAVEDRTDRDLDAWAATGLSGLRVLRDVVTGVRNPQWNGRGSRAEGDNLTDAAAAIAAAHPADFLDVFANPRLDTNHFVLIGLGHVDDPRATARLTGAAKSRDPFIRGDAAIGLGRRKSPLAIAALVELLHDPDDGVRYHALKGLAEVGDETAAVALRDLAAPTEFERRLVEQALSAIESRGQ